MAYIGDLRHLSRQGMGQTSADIRNRIEYEGQARQQPARVPSASPGDPGHPHAQAPSPATKAAAEYPAMDGRSRSHA